MHKYLIYIIFCSVIISCNSQENKSSHYSEDTNQIITSSPKNDSSFTYDTSMKTIHILVALCDNQYQGIVPVPKSIGNGQDPKNNLYWGTAYGIKTYFKRSSEWIFIKEYQVDSIILSRVVFKHKNRDYYLIADAYDGKYIKQTTLDFLNSSAGLIKDTLHVDTKAIGIHGNSNLISYIGHDGLMDFRVNDKFVNIDTKERDVIILACYSKSYFQPHLSNANVNPLVWTTGLMAPEAYTIHDAISGYVLGESNEEIRARAAQAYHKYQKCGIQSAMRLLVTD